MNGVSAFALFYFTTVVGIAVDTNGNGVYDPGIDQILTGPETTGAGRQWTPCPRVSSLAAPRP